MCRLIARDNSTLIGERNKDGETPFFQAVLNGSMDAFLCLHYMCKPDEDYSDCKTKNGETILHSAISGEYFDLAYNIIQFYPNLVNAVTEDGATPLLLLACKPSAFRSGSYIRGFRRLIYYCIFVDVIDPVHNSSQGSQVDTKAKYPENYQTCIGFAGLVRKIFRVPKTDEENPQGKQPDTNHGRSHLPPNYVTRFNAIKLISKSMLVILGLGSHYIIKLREEKQKHIRSVQIVDELLKRAKTYEYENRGKTDIFGPDLLSLSNKHDVEIPFLVLDAGIPPDILGPLSKPGDDHTPQTSDGVDRKNGTNGNGNKKKMLEIEKGETALLVAAKKGVVEMVEKIIELFPVAINDMDTSKKNIVLLAVENRQPRVYKFLLDEFTNKDTIFRKVDINGNSALHLAAKMGDRRPWLIPGAALLMQWEIKWYEFVKGSVPLRFFAPYNREKKTARDIFRESHKDLIKSGDEWLTSTSNSWSIVAALIATVAFATSTTFPGGFKEESNKPTFANEPAFNIFTIASFFALCFSLTSVIMFLAILTSRFQEDDFRKDLPIKLLVGLTTLFVSIASTMVSFCSSHFFVLSDDLKHFAFPVYAITCLLVTFFTMAQFPYYFDLIWSIFTKVPQPSYE